MEEEESSGITEAEGPQVTAGVESSSLIMASLPLWFPSLWIAFLCLHVFCGKLYFLHCFIFVFSLLRKKNQQRSVYMISIVFLCYTYSELSPGKDDVVGPTLVLQTTRASHGDLLIPNRRLYFSSAWMHRSPIQYAYFRYCKSVNYPLILKKLLIF